MTQRKPAEIDTFWVRSGLERGPRPLKTTWVILKFDMRPGLSDMRHGGYTFGDMGHSHFLHSTCDIEKNKERRYAALPFLKIDMRPPPPPSPSIKGPWRGHSVTRGMERLGLTGKVRGHTRGQGHDLTIWPIIHGSVLTLTPFCVSNRVSGD